MGGGDLNLKKSWHPSTLRNIERVWKAEQKHEAEQQKIEQLQKELAAERAREEIHAYGEDQGVLKKRNERLDWMYQGPAALVNREDYLMGRKIDKTLELLEIQESGFSTGKDKDSAVGSIFKPGASTSGVTVDLANKIKEDPLFAIMKREKEQRKNLLNNPVKMKMLKDILQKSLTKNKNKHKKLEKNKDKKKQHRSSSSNNSESEEEQATHKPEKKRNDHAERYSNSEHQKRSSSNYKTRYDRFMIHDNEHDRCLERKHRKRDFHGKKHDKKSTLNKVERSHPTMNKFSKDSHQNFSNHSINQKQNLQIKKQLSSAEKERLRQEMMDNAKWREHQRLKNVERYIKESELEDIAVKGNASNFIKPMLSKAADFGSVENRVKQKIFTIQRKKGDMDCNFARR